MIGLAYFLIIWLGVGLLTGIKFIIVDQVYDEEKELMNKETAAGKERIWPTCFSKISLTLLPSSC
ncbi:hypothetical protein NRS6094_03980 [Bacillus subtilis]|nr:hypothetical protein NRS6094_03980 [Bacillus subtilis]